MHREQTATADRLRRPLSAGVRRTREHGRTRVEGAFTRMAKEAIAT